MSTPKTATDFGEPWHWNTDEGIAYDRTKGWCPSLHGNGPRLVACLNACAGMSDPAAEIQALRDAVKEASTTLENCYQVHRAITLYAPQSEDDKSANRGHCEKISAALAKLRSLL